MKNKTKALALLVIGLSIAPAVFAGTWVARVSPLLYEISFSELAPLYTFSDNDRLIALNSETHTIKPFLHEPGLRYLVDDIPLVITPSQISGLASATQDGLKDAGFNELLPGQRRCEETTVAVLDSGVDESHAAFSHISFVTPYNATQDSSLVTDEYGHGTHVAGIIAANNSLGTQGACTSATVMPIKFLNRFGGGNISDAIKGIQWAIDHHATILNHSWAVSRYSQALFDVMEDADQQNIVQVLAAGNSNLNLNRSNAYPASFAQQLPGAIAVANWDIAKQSLNTTSNHGAASVDIAAPGTDILSLVPNDQTRTESGTSMATPLVTALAAMLRQQYPDKTNKEIRAQILAGASYTPSLAGKLQQQRRLNAPSAMALNAEQPMLLTAKQSDTTLTIVGTHLDRISQWWYQEAKTNGVIEELTPTSHQADQVSFVSRDAATGWVVGETEQGREVRYMLSPQLPAPNEIQATSIDSGALLSWQGKTYVDTYHLYYSDDNGPYRKLTDVHSPTNQYLDTSTKDNRRYKLRSSYQIVIESYSETVWSDYSDPLSVNSQPVTPTSPWLSQLLADIPVGVEAHFPLFDQNENPIDNLLFAEDEKHIAQIENSNTLSVATDRATETNITVFTEEERQTYSVNVIDDEHWQLEDLVFIGNNLAITSVQKFNDDSIYLTGKPTSEDSFLQIESLNNTAELSLSGAELNAISLPDENVQTHNSHITIAPAFDKEDSFSIRMHIDSNSSRAIASSSSDSRCFIASAVYTDQPEKLTFFRGFRDNILIKLPLGEQLVDYYYRWSPTWVVKAESYPQLKSAMWVILEAFYYLALNFKLILLLLFSLVIIRLQGVQKLIMKRQATFQGSLSDTIEPA